MPTPVSAARQSLAAEAAAALDEAVSLARHRAHAQTSSLHVVSALLSSSSSLLRDALSRAHSAAYSPRLQFKALELCFSVALDRLPSAVSTSGGGPPAEPPVSNSFMAAIKRSQANQRRNMDAFLLYQNQQRQQQEQQQQQQNSSVSVKVELQQLVLSILDDPVVSRVFADAGFRSYDVKFAILRPPPSTLRFPVAGRRPPLFLCNFSADDFDPSLSFPFPFSTQPLRSDGADENCRRIAEVLARKTGRNPLLVGVGATDAARDFEKTIISRNWASFPPEARGVRFFSIEKEITEFVSGSRDQAWLDSRFSNVGLWLTSPGVVMCFGDLKRLVEVVEEDKEGGVLERVSHVVTEMGRMIEGHLGRLWLMGSAVNYETYMTFLTLYPSVDKDWDLQLLPITSVKPGSGGLPARTSSLMDSFVPFGGFFPISSDSGAPFSREYHSPVPCQVCSDEYDQEVAALLKELSAPVGVEYQVNLTPCEQQTEPTSINSGIDMEKAKDDGAVLNVKIMDLRRKWSDICQRRCHGNQILGRDIRVGSETLSHLNDLQHDAYKERSGDQANGNIAGSQGQSTVGIIFPMVGNLQETASASQSISMPMISEMKNENLLSKVQLQPSKSEQLPPNQFQSHSGGVSLLGSTNDHMSTLSMASVSTDLMIGTVQTSISKPEKAILHPRAQHILELCGCLESQEVDVGSGSVSASPCHYSSCVAFSHSAGVNIHLPVNTAPHLNVTHASASASDQLNQYSSNICQPFDTRDLKVFCRSLTEKVGWQEDAIRAISQTIVRCKADNRRHNGGRVKGDIWLSFIGPDVVGKWKIAVALAELLFGSREKLICVDLNLQDELMHSNMICNNREIYGYKLNLRGKTVVDYIAGEIRKKPLSVVLLENVDKADLLVQSSLLQAIKTGRFSDSHRREVGINNVVFVTTAGAVGCRTHFSSKVCGNFSEEMVLAARAWQMKIVVEYASDTIGTITHLDASSIPSKVSTLSVLVGKRKLDMVDDGKGKHEPVGTAKRVNKAENILLDLNLPVEEMEATDMDYDSDETNCMAESMEVAWMNEFLDTVDETVIFKPVNFDAFADDMLKEINKSIESMIGSEFVLEIDPKVMEQILAANWVSEDKEAVNNWIRHVLVRGFMEAREVHVPRRRVLRLIACDDAYVGDYAPGIHLPSSILFN